MSDDNLPVVTAIKLDGTLIKSDGTTSQSKYFNFLDKLPDDYSNLSYTPEEAERIQHHLQFLSTGSAAAVPLVCGGAVKCPWAEKCPLVTIDRERRKVNPTAPLLTPFTKSCLIEINLLNEWTRLYIKEYDIVSDSFTELLMARELAEIELMLWRLNNNISKPENASLVQQSVVGMDKEGNVLTRQEISAFLEAKERLANRKARLIKLMVGDRQEKYKRDAALHKTDEKDASISAAKLRQKLNQLIDKANKTQQALRESEGGIIEVSEYHSVPPQDESVNLSQSPDDLIATISNK